MSSGKSILGIALQPALYSADIDTFATRLAHAMKLNLSVDHLIFFGNYQYPFSDRLVYEDAQASSFQEIVNSARELDGLAVVDFNQLLQGKLDADIPYEWLVEHPRKVVLLHEVHRLPSIRAHVDK